jgi:hypothetical protein
MAREELKWQNIDADDLPAAVKKSFDAMVEAEANFKADLEKLLKDEGHMPEDKFLILSRKGKRLGVAFASTPRGEGGAGVAEVQNQMSESTAQVTFRISRSRTGVGLFATTPIKKSSERHSARPFRLARTAARRTDPNFSSMPLRCSSRALILSSIEKRAASARALSGSATAFSCPSRPINARWRLSRARASAMCFSSWSR